MFDGLRPSRTRLPLLIAAAALLAAPLTAVQFAASPALAGDSKAGDGEAADGKDAKEKDAAKKVDEIAEAGKLVAGPAGQPECVWVGRRIVGLMWRDDLETAMRHRELYEKFGCPFPHIQDAFRCVVRNGELDPKAPEALSLRIHHCWVNPALVPAPAAPPATADAAEPAAPKP